ncbi:MAG TPA: polysaccharide biosynthesis/export family protein, partial [Candidatus Baltobacteraceae bacterium]
MQRWIAAAFCALALALGTTAASATDDRSYKIAPGDQLAVAVFGDATLTQTVTVLPDGRIALPLIGDVSVGGSSTKAAGATIARALARYVRHPIVTVALAAQGTMNVLVLGDVKTPGKYAVRSNARLSDAIAAAGGLGDTNGDLPIARIASSAG